MLTFLLANLALAFYNIGTIWAHEVDIFRSWRLVDPKDFPEIQRAHWRKLPYWIFAPVAFALAGNIALIWYHPAGSPTWAIWTSLLCQSLSIVLTALFWGRWQAALSRDRLGPSSPYLTNILKTHWVRTLLITAYGAILLFWAVSVAGVAPATLPP